MGVSDELWEIETVIEDELAPSDREIEHRTAQARRSLYEQTLVDVDQLAGSEAMHTLSSWIKREIKTAGRLPASHEVRQVGTEICRRSMPPNRSPKL